MDISFKKNKLMKVVDSERELYKTFGKENGRLIQRRMAFLQAAPTLADVPHTKPERRHELGGKRKGQFAVDVKHPQRIIFRPNHKPLPRKDDGGLDLTRITSIEILVVEDYHK